MGLPFFWVKTNLWERPVGLSAPDTSDLTSALGNSSLFFLSYIGIGEIDVSFLHVYLVSGMFEGFIDPLSPVLTLPRGHQGSYYEIDISSIFL